MAIFVPFSSDEEITVIGRGLLDRSLPKAAWIHAAHFAATLWLLTHGYDHDLEEKMPALIRGYNEATGVANTDDHGYHETITMASIRAARAFLDLSPMQPLYFSCNALMASPLGRSGWLLDYWSRARLFSVEARRNWLEPDMKKLPF